MASRGPRKRGAFGRGDARAYNRLEQRVGAGEGVRAGSVLEVKPREPVITKEERERGKTRSRSCATIYPYRSWSPRRQPGAPLPSPPVQATTTPSIARSGRGKGKKKKSLGQAFPECASCWRWARGCRGGAAGRDGRAGGGAAGPRGLSARPGPQHGRTAAQENLLPPAGPGETSPEKVGREGAR